MSGVRAEGLVALDLRAAQSRHYRERGIARFVFELTSALVEHHPDLVGSVLVDPDAPPVRHLDAIAESGRLTTPARWEARERVFHAMSPFDLDVPVRQLWPRRAIGVHGVLHRDRRYEL